MQINRLFETVYILLNQKSITAKALAEHFGVSSRTVYRDVETLSTAGIPIYMSKGKGGGISLLDNFVLNKSVLTEHEQTEILSALHGLNTLSVPNTDSILNKLGILFNKGFTNWIDIDYSYWGSDPEEKEKFNILKNAILSRLIIQFVYYAPGSKGILRTVEPLQIYFKEKAWYLKAYCTERQDYRTFKIARMNDISTTNQSFIRELPEQKPYNFDYICKLRTVVEFFEPAWARFYDEMGNSCIVEKTDKSIIAEIYFPEVEWILSYIMSYADTARVLEPEDIALAMKSRLEKTLKLYF